MLLKNKHFKKSDNNSMVYKRYNFNSWIRLITFALSVRTCMNSTKQINSNTHEIFY